MTFFLEWLFGMIGIGLSYDFEMLNWIKFDMYIVVHSFAYWLDIKGWLIWYVWSVF